MFASIPFAMEQVVPNVERAPVGVLVAAPVEARREVEP